jgi:GTP-binding protein
MRREGYEFQVSRPEVITKEVDGRTLEPVEHLVIDTTEPFVGVVTDLVGGRRARMLDMVNDGRGGVRLEFAIPTRGLIGLRNAFLTATKGNGVMASRLIGFEPWLGAIASNRTGALVASEGGIALAHGIANAQERGLTFIEPQSEVYEGMIVGQQPRQGDLVVNVCRSKKLTNIRSSTSDIAVKLTPPVVLSLEQALDFLADDELLEVTPKAFRLPSVSFRRTSARRSGSGTRWRRSEVSRRPPYTGSSDAPILPFTDGCRTPRANATPIRLRRSTTRAGCRLLHPAG